MTMALSGFYFCFNFLILSTTNKGSPSSKPFFLLSGYLVGFTLKFLDFPSYKSVVFVYVSAKCKQKKFFLHLFSTPIIESAEPMILKWSWYLSNRLPHASISPWSFWISGFNFPLPSTNDMHSAWAIFLRFICNLSNSKGEMLSISRIVLLEIFFLLLILRSRFCSMISRTLSVPVITNIFSSCIPYFRSYPCSVMRALYLE